MRRRVGLAAVAALGVVATGCMGGGSHHGTLSATDALAQARRDGFVKAMRQAQPPSWLCDRNDARIGPAAPSGRFADYVRANYAIMFEDTRVPPGPGDAARIAMMVIVFPKDSFARRCAEAAIYESMHASADTPSKRLDGTTVITAPHPPGAPGFANDVDDGTYDTWIAHGRVFALGLAYNEPHSQIVRENLERLAAEIAG
jgi:hypothetical protein